MEDTSPPGGKTEKCETESRICLHTRLLQEEGWRLG